MAEQLALAGGSGSSNSTYEYLGWIAPLGGGLGEPGFRARLWLAGIQFNYDAAGNLGEVKGRGGEFEGALGHMWTLGDTSVTFYGSLKYRSIKLHPSDPDSDTEHQHFGVGVQGEFEHRFSQDWGLTGIALYTALVKNYWSRLRPHWNTSELQLGPEFIFSGGDQYTDNRYGIFVEGLPLGRLRLGLSGGAEYQRRKNTAAYGSLGLSLLF